MATGWIGMVNSEAKSWAAQLPQSLTKNKNALAYFETARAWTGAAICDDSGTGAIKPFVIGGGDLPLQRHAARRRGLGGNLLGGRNGQGRRPEPAQVPGMAAGRDAQRR